MRYTWRTYDTLQVEFEKAVLLLRGSHESVPVDKLPTARRDQVLFIQKTIDALEKRREDLSSENFEDAEKPPVLVEILETQRHDSFSESEEDTPGQTIDELDEENAFILTGALLLIHQQIASEYKYISPTKSTFYNALNQSLGLTPDHSLQAEDRITCVSALRAFISNCIFINGNSELGLVDSHEYLDTPIQALWNLIIDIESQAQKEIMHRNLESARLARLTREEREREALETKERLEREAAERDIQNGSGSFLSRFSLWGSSSASTSSSSQPTLQLAPREMDDVKKEEPIEQVTEVPLQPSQPGTVADLPSSPRILSENQRLMFQ